MGRNQALPKASCAEKAVNLYGLLLFYCITAYFTVFAELACQVKRQLKEESGGMALEKTISRAGKGRACRVYDTFCYDDIFDLDEFDIEDIRDIVSLCRRPAFAKGIAGRLNELGVHVEVQDTGLILKEIKQRYKNRIGVSCPRTIQEWVRGTVPGVTNRVNNYNLCYALEMNLKETADFFVKYYLTTPFNYKDKIDAIFFYCLYHQRPYAVIERMLKESEEFEAVKISGTKTAEIGRRILEIKDDDAFMQYLSVHCYNNEQQYQIARGKITALLDKYERSSAAGLHEDIMGFNYQDMMRSHMEKRMVLPDEFLRSLPTDRTFLDIRSGKRETYQTLRKTLVILAFYDFYIDVQKMTEEPDEKTVRDNLSDFYESVNEKLLDCGLPPMYEGHPFDRLILFCAASRYPISTFYGLNDMRYSENRGK